jgi:hypothetical protein
MLGLGLSLPQVAVRRAGGGISPPDPGPPWIVLASDDTPYIVSNTVLDSAGVSYNVVSPVLSSNGTSYNPI